MIAGAVPVQAFSNEQAAHWLYLTAEKFWC
jgi:hypothetical protein